MGGPACGFLACGPALEPIEVQEAVVGLIIDGQAPMGPSHAVNRPDLETASRESRILPISNVPEHGFAQGITGRGEVDEVLEALT